MLAMAGQTARKTWLFFEKHSYSGGNNIVIQIRFFFQNSIFFI